MPIPYYFYKAMPRNISEYQIKLICLSLQYLLIYKPVCLIMRTVFQNRSDEYRNLINLLILSMPCIFDQSCLFIDIQGIFYVGFCLKTLQYLLSDGTQHAKLSIACFILAIHSCIYSSLYLQPAIAYFIYRKIQKRAKDKV